MNRTRAYTFTRALRAIITAALLTPLAASVGMAQETGSRTGIIDLTASIERQIAQIEERLRGDPDMAAEKQAAYHLWLIELCDSTGQYDRVIQSFEKIISFFPYDVGFLNRYAKFMLERKQDAERAEQLVRQARQFAGLINVTDVDRGTTLYLQAAIDTGREQYETAISALTTAAFLCEEEPRKQRAALSLLSRTYALAGRYDQAVSTYLELLGKQEVHTPEELSRLQNLLNLSPHERGASPGDLIAEAAENERRKRRERIEREGAQLVDVPLPPASTLEGTFYRGSRSGAVIYLAPSGGTRLTFRLFAQLIFTEGVSVLSLDPPAAGLQGESATAEEIRQAAVAAAVSYLERELAIGEEQIILITEGALCETIELSLFEHHLRCPVLYLSPLFDRASKPLASAVPFRPDLPLLILYSLEDRAALLSQEHFQSLAPLPRLDVMRLEKAGHGVEILKRSPAALEHFLDWIAGVLNLPR